jgi:hypothetical protein
MKGMKQINKIARIQDYHTGYKITRINKNLREGYNLNFFPTDSHPWRPLIVLIDPGILSVALTEMIEI